MVDAGAGPRGDPGLGAIGDAEAGGLKHLKIVGAVADGERLMKGKAPGGGDLLERVELGLVAKDRLDHLAGELAALDHERIGAILVGAEPLGDRSGELAKAARDDGDMGASRPHRPDKRPGAGIEGDAVSQRLGDDALREAGDQGDALAQGRLEGDLALHRPLGDPRHLLAHAGAGRQFVDAFLADKRRVHVRDQEALQAPGERLDDDIDGLAGKRALERRALGLKLAGEYEIGRDPFAKPAPALDAAKGLRGPVECCFAEPLLHGVGDERGDEDGHEPSSDDGERRAVKRALLIAGPTASGKSAAALALAARFGATIVNADSMQVYADLRILTARPTMEEERLAPHRLFGTVDGAVNYSAGRWARAAREILAEPGGRPVIFAGGSGLYLRALTEGFSDIPQVPDALRSRIRAEAEGRATADLHAELAGRDPETAARLNASDRQRILRALEVMAATERPLASFFGARASPALEPHEWAGLYLAPDRAELYRRIDARFDAMLAEGALDEVSALMKRDLDPALPVMRAHGVPHLIANLEGRITLAEAAERSKLDIRHYAKRQFTWARRQMTGFRWVAPEEAAAEGARALGGS